MKWSLTFRQLKSPVQPRYVCARLGRTLVLTSPLVLVVAVDGLVVDQVGVVPLEDGGQRDAARPVLLHRVVARPVEVHL